MKASFTAVLDMADGINTMYERLCFLESENAHLHAMVDKYQQGLQETFDSNNRQIGTILTALIDPDSNINRVGRIVARAQLAGITDEAQPVTTQPKGEAP